MRRARIAVLPGFVAALLSFGLAGAARANSDSAAADSRGTAAPFAAALERIRPAVVRIDTVGGAVPVVEVQQQGGETISVPVFRQAIGPTTGVVWSHAGEIVSSSFNFMREPTVTTVALSDGRRFVARLVARDKVSRIALLRVDANDLPAPVRLAVGEWPRPGQWALTAGFGQGTRLPALSAGVVSAIRRSRGLTIQTDAKTSPANYGGPLFDLDGRLLGVCVPLAGEGDAEVAGVEWYDSGIGFAVQSDEVDAIVARLRGGRDLEAGFLGIGFDARAPVVGEGQPAGVGISELSPGPGRDAGLRLEDRVVAIGGSVIARPVDLERALARYRAGDTIAVTVVRDGVSGDYSVSLVGAAALEERIRLEPTSQPGAASQPLPAVPVGAQPPGSP